MANDTKQMKLRMPAALVDWLEESARRNFRTLNAEVAFRLTTSKEREEAAAATTEPQ